MKFSSIKYKILLLAVMSIVVTTVFQLVILILERAEVAKSTDKAEGKIKELVLTYAETETSKIANDVYLMCQSVQNMLNLARFQDDAVFKEETNAKELMMADPEVISVLSDSIMNITVGKTGYVYVLGAKGEDKGHYIISMGGTRNGESIWDAKDSSGNYFIQNVVNSAVGLDRRTGNDMAFVRYPWKNEGEAEARMKIAAVSYFEAWDWVIVAGAYEDDYQDILHIVENDFDYIHGALASMQSQILYFSLISILVIACIAYWLASRMAQPINHAVEVIKKVTQGDLKQRLRVKTSDEVGVISDSINHLTEQLQKIIHEVKSYTGTLSVTSKGFLDNAKQLASAEEQISHQTDAVAVAGQQLSSNVQGVASTAEELSAAANNVSASIEEMSASIDEVASNCEKEKCVAERANIKAKETSEVMSALGKSADEIGSVIQLISNIADQTNLLALNATIEAASAGEAGKGFGVVATEVKELARQSADATDKISASIENIQACTRDSVHQITEITSVIDEMYEISNSIAAAVEQQSAAANEISKTVANVSAASVELSMSVNESSSAADEVAHNIVGVREASAESAVATLENETTSYDIARMAERLTAITSGFNSGEAAFNIAEIKSAHMQWVSRLSRVMLGKLDMKSEEVASDQECAFGKWFYSDAGKSMSKHPAYAEVEKHHSKIHSIAREIVGLIENNRKDKAELMMHDFEETRRSLFLSLDQLYTAY